MNNPNELKKRSTKAYVLTLVAILSNILSNNQDMDSALEEIKKLNSKTGQLYFILATHVLDQIRAGSTRTLDSNNKKIKKLLEYGEEIRLIIDLLNP